LGVFYGELAEGVQGIKGPCRETRFGKNSWKKDKVTAAGKVDG
jgi:hypothetical protein